MAKFFKPLRDIINVFISIDIDELALEIAKTREFQKLVIQLNTEGQSTSQLFELGEDSTGKKLSDIGGDYSPFTLQKAAEEGKPKRSADHVDLKDTGAFYLTFSINPFKGGFRIEADPLKDGTNLFDEWGKDIVGLQDQNLQIVIDYHINEFIERLNNKLRAA